MMHDMDRLFDIFCQDDRQRRRLEVLHQLRMDERDFAFYSDQKEERKSQTVNIVEKLTPSDAAFKRKTNKLHQLPETSIATTSNLNTSIPTTSEESASNANSSSSSDFNPFSGMLDEQGKNRTELTNLVLMCERFNVSDRAGAAIANAVLKDYGVTDQQGTASVIDRSKLRRERSKYREKIREEESVLFSKVDALYVDGKKDATLVMTEKGGVKRRQIQLEEHYVLVGEPGEYYLSHISTTSGKGQAIAQGIKDAITGTSLEDTLSVIGSDGTAAMTGPFKGAIRCLEELLNRPLQWSICLLHTNELPLRHVFTTLDGKSKGPDLFSGSIGKQLNGDASAWNVVEFDKIPNPDFPLLSEETIHNLSSDQYYAYKISIGIISGNIQDVCDLKVGPLCHARWLTLACRILRFYASQENPSINLIILAKFCVYVYFPSWFQIKKRHFITDGAKNYFDILARVRSFPDEDVQKVCFKVLQRNAFFANAENVLLAMLADDNEEVRNDAVMKVLAIRNATSSKETFCESEKTATTSSTSDIPIRRFVVPSVNFQASCYYEMTNNFSESIEEPPLTQNLSRTDIANIQHSPLVCLHPCHNQAVERHVKVVTEAAAVVCGMERRDGLIRQRLKSRKLMTRFDTRKQFAC